MQSASASCRFSIKHSRVLPGLLTLAVALCAFFWAYLIKANQPLSMLALVFSIGVLASLVLSTFACIAAFAKLSRTSLVDLASCEAGSRFTLLEAIVDPLLTLFAPAHVLWEAIDPAGKSQEIEVAIDASGRENVRFKRRCVIRRLRRLVCVSDRLGLFKFAIEQIVPAKILVLPRKRRFKRVCLSGDATDLDMRPDLSGNAVGDLIETRQYREGESAKNMLWKVAARTGGQVLVVRTEERVIGGKIAMYFLATGSGDDAAAEFVRNFAEQSGAADDWILGVSGDRNVYVRRNKAKALEAIAMTGIAGDCDWVGLHNFASRQAPQFGVSTATVVVGGEPDARTRELLLEISSKSKGSNILFCPTHNRKHASFPLPGRVRLVHAEGGDA